MQEFETRLAIHAGGEEGSVATVANATVGLTLALLVHELPPGSLCMVPAWTFAATAHAIELAGLVPWIVDVDLQSWALETPAARELLANAPAPVSAVMPVSPFGAPIDSRSWEMFRDQTGVAVIIDAAAAFDTVQAGAVPAVVSLHATKVLGVGEGGFVVTTDTSFIEETQKRANFGFWNSREAKVRSLNAKLSAYAAAVGLAGLDSWEEIRADFHRIGNTYRKLLAEESGAKLQHCFAEKWLSSTVVIAAQQTSGDALASALAGNRIGSRRWWGGGLHRHAAFRQLPRDTTAHADLLADTVIGLPCWRDLPNDQIERICEVVTSSAR